MNRAAGGLRALGVRPGDRVALFMPMCPELVAAFFAVIKVGGIVLPLFSGYGADAVTTRLQDAGVKVLDHGRWLLAPWAGRANEGDGRRVSRRGAVSRARDRGSHASAQTSRWDRGICGGSISWQVNRTSMPPSAPAPTIR